MGSGEWVVGDFRPACRFMGGTIRDDLNPRALDPVAVGGLNALPAAVTTVGIAGIRVGLLHGPVGIEDVHVTGKGCAGILATDKMKAKVSPDFFIKVPPMGLQA